MITIKGLYKTHYPHKLNPIKALEDINLNFEAGEFVAIVGASGSGKSTFLHVLGGLDKADNGEIIYNQQNLNDLEDRQLSDYRKDTVGFIFQNFNLINHMTALENVMLALSMTLGSKQAKTEKCMQALKDVGLEHATFQMVNELSGGQKQRVAIARALVKSPKIILADEPTGALDSKTADEIIELLKIISKRGCLVIVVTHSEAVASMASRVIRVKDGSITEDYKTTLSIKDEKPEETNTAIQNRAFNFIAALKLSLHRILNKKWRYFLVSLGVIIGICGLGLALSLSSGINKYTHESIDKVTDSKKLTVTKEGNYMNSSDYFEIKKDEKVVLVQPEYDISARIEKDSELINFNVKPLLNEKYRKQYATPNLLFGELPQDNNEGIVISENTALKLINKGENIKDLVGREFEISFLSPDPVTNQPSRWDRHTVKISGISEQAFIGEDYSYISYGFHKDIAKRSRFVSENSDIPVNKLSVYMENRESVKTETAKLSKTYTVITPEDVLKNMTKMFDIIKFSVAGVSLLILLISVVMVGVILYISVLERKNEIGLLKALGGRNTDIKMIFLSEALLLGSISSAAGILLCAVAQMIINHFIQPIVKFNILQFSLLSVFLCIVFGVFINLIAGLVPAGKAAKLDPVELLRE